MTETVTHKGFPRWIWCMRIGMQSFGALQTSPSSRRCSRYGWRWCIHLIHLSTLGAVAWITNSLCVDAEIAPNLNSNLRGSVQTAAINIVYGLSDKAVNPIGCYGQSVLLFAVQSLNVFYTAAIGCVSHTFSPLWVVCAADKGKNVILLLWLRIQLINTLKTKRCSHWTNSRSRSHK